MSSIKILVVGASSQVGSALCARALSVEMSVVSFNDHAQDILSFDSLTEIVAKHQPNYVVNVTGSSSVDCAQDQLDEKSLAEHEAVLLLAKVCNALSIPLLHLSTDYVFDGQQHAPYKEEAYTAPVNRYGEAKLAFEKLIKQHCHQHIILRVGWIFSAQGNNFVLRTLRQLQQHDSVKAVSDQQGCPTYANDVAGVMIAIINQLECDIEVWGTYHYSGAEVTTWKGFAEAILAAAKKHGATQAQTIEAVTSLEWPANAPRPAYSVLDCSKILSTFGIRQRPWRSGLVKVIDQVFKPVSID
ncbi:dTDP-4-dehydrorhamnose reductase [Oceanospirillaceae bacterium]|jgi:dTDP-4-dehydrorhamnose reductase|uniref:dTDP-4-dehydrorhamnose reductase n=1 Tax=Candidatus Njordibacter sp. Uisw_002 TaxID=3230971 RepID=UPI00233D9148|nr:dTDP-4-dehydrorhamnose reductase [Oceanospirillaceae bacterium]|tara:strand:- start:2467 stop:3366 length:900 start_codon:yes stop_codon:yes gene_type:complete